MEKLVSVNRLLRQHDESDRVVPGIGWEKRVASLERMRLAMKNSRWGIKGDDHVTMLSPAAIKSNKPPRIQAAKSR